MPFEIKLSEIGGHKEEFAVAVEAFIAKLIAFNKEVGKPRPTTSPLIEAAIKRIQVPKQPDKYEADYVFVDDTPPPPQALSLDDKKNECHRKLYAAETVAKDLVMAPRKRRLAEMQYQVAVSKKEEDRTTEDNENIAAFIEANKKWVELSLIAAKAESDIEDLTEANVDNWELPKFGAE